jgi:transcription elongation factor Elf1
MINRKILYGYQIQNSELTVYSEEAAVVGRITTLYLAGASYQKIADTLNTDCIPFSADAPLWNKHKVKRLLENPRYTGTDGYPAIIEKERFEAVQAQIQSKTAACVPTKPRPALRLKEHLRCEHCGSSLHRTAGANRRTDTLYLKCDSCGMQITIADADLLTEINRQLAEHDVPDSSYTPSGESVRLANAINRSLERPDAPEAVVSLILQGVSARYDCCPAAQNESHRPVEADPKGFDRAVSHITISSANAVTVHFK